MSDFYSDKNKEYNNIIFDYNIAIKRADDAKKIEKEMLLTKGKLYKLEVNIVDYVKKNNISNSGDQYSNLNSLLYKIRESKTKIKINQDKLLGYKSKKSVLAVNLSDSKNTHNDDSKISKAIDLVFDNIKLNDSYIRDNIFNKIMSMKMYNPKIGVFGKSGVGKSTLCNAIFGKDVFNVSAVSACTRKKQEEVIKHGSNELTIIDYPGIGENEERDREYYNLYSNEINNLDLILWVIKADDRALSVDENFYKNVIKGMGCEDIIMFVINQSDKIEPSIPGWDMVNNKPSFQQEISLKLKEREIKNSLFTPRYEIVHVSSNTQIKYNINKLIEVMIGGLPNEKRGSLFKFIPSNNKTKKSEDDSKSGYDNVISEMIDVVIDYSPIPQPVKTLLRAGKDIIKKGLSGLYNLVFG